MKCELYLFLTETTPTPQHLLPETWGHLLLSPGLAAEPWGVAVGPWGGVEHN